MKKIMTFATAALMTAGLVSSSAFAVSSTAPEDKMVLVEDYIEKALPYHFKAQGIDASSDVSYSTPIPLYDFNDFSVIGYETFIIDTNDLIGKMDIYTGDNMSSLFDTQITDEITAAYNNNVDMAIGYYDDCLLLYTEDKGYSLIDGLYSGYPTCTPAVSDVSVSDKMINTELSARATLGSKYLNISHVHNSTNINPDGECWAACCAMVLNYKQGRSLTADDICLAMQEEGSPFHSPYAYDYYGYSYTIQKDLTPDCGAMSSNAVWEQISNNRPVSITVKTASSASHQVVICGMLVDSNFTTYRIDNPNTKTKQTFTIDGNPTVVTDSISYGRYTKWTQSIY